MSISICTNALGKWRTSTVQQKASQPLNKQRTTNSQNKGPNRKKSGEATKRKTTAEKNVVGQNGWIMLFIQIRVYSRLHPVTAPLLLSVPGTGLLVHLIRLYSFFFFRHLFRLRSAFFKISVVVCPSTHLNFRMYAFVSFCVFVSKQFLSNRAKKIFKLFKSSTQPKAHAPRCMWKCNKQRQLCVFSVCITTIFIVTYDSPTGTISTYIYFV